MLIHNNFVGGNIRVVDRENNEVFLESEFRDSPDGWFYWAFCVEGAENEEITFHLETNRLGYFGPAVSYDLVNWHWLGSGNIDNVNGDSFTYKFSENERKVYFAHSMLYHPDRFLNFAKKHNLIINELCKGYKGSSIPCVKFGQGSISIILTARHHACESTGNYVLEGVLGELITNPIPDTKVLCVPFVDYEGVIRGDQGKGRVPHDHNRDYSLTVESIYPECNAIKKYAEENGCHYGFDFHSPWHMTKENDNVFIVQNSIEKLELLNLFGKMFEESITDKSLNYECKNDYPPEVGWNKGGPQFANYMRKREENNIAFSLETAYFGNPDNEVTEDKLLELGRCFARALARYILKMKTE